MVTVATEEAAASSTEQCANIRVVAEARDLLPARLHHCFERRNESHTSQLPNQFSRGERYRTHLCQFYRRVGGSSHILRCKTGPGVCAPWINRCHQLQFACHELEFQHAARRI
ncbi:unnamed protein product [Sphagnum tenellum]